MLEKQISSCGLYDTKIVSKDKHSSVRHIGLNEKGKNKVRQFQLDGEVIKNKICCDYLLLNDTKENAYYIELKGSDIKHGIKQLEETAKLFEKELEDYQFYYRLVSSKVNTHDIKSSEYRKFKERHFKYFLHKNNEIIEKL